MAWNDHRYCQGEAESEGEGENCTHGAMMSLAGTAVKPGGTMIEIHGSDRLGLYGTRMKMKRAVIDKDEARKVSIPGSLVRICKQTENKKAPALPRP
jgi:hypothetical protein